MRHLASQSIRKYLAAVAFTALLCCSAIFAQSGAGSIKGTVTDSTGAVIPGASVHVVNQATGVMVDTKTNAVGFYQVPELFTGTYEVSITANGMKTYNQTLDLLVAQDAVVNISLTTGAVTQQVTVSANTVQLQTTDSGTITSTLENARINELPMNGRNIITLVNEVTPGLENCPESSSCGNGQEGPSTEYESDGATLTNREFGGTHQGQNQMVDPDAVQEVRVLDATAGAQYASPTTVVLNTKSGTNQLHGSAFWTARNNGFGVARTRINPSNYVAPEYIRNEAGASVGGPIVIPHLYRGKDRTFFFFAYERYSLAQSPFQSEEVATPQMVNGDFSQATNSSGVLQQLYDLTTTGSSAIGNSNTAACLEPPGDGVATAANAFCRSTYTAEYTEGPGSGPPNCNGDTNCMPISQQAALFKTLMAMQPNTTGPNGVLNTGISPVAANNYTGKVRELTTEPQITWRLDQVFNENNRAYLRYTQNLTNSISPRNDPNSASYTLAATAPGGAAIPALASGVSVTPSNVYAAALGYTHVFSPTFYSETVLSQSWYGEHNFAGGTPNADFETELGLPNNFKEPGFPLIEYLFGDFGSTQFQYSVTTTTYNIDENLSKTLGKHQLQFGARYRFEHIGSIPDEVKDTFQFGTSTGGGYATALLNPTSYSASAATAYTNSGNADADAFLGASNSYSNNIEPPYQHLHDMEIDGYLQDNYRMRNNLTFNLGLRWEAHPAMYEGQGAMMGFDIKNDAVVTSGSLTQLESENLTTAAVIADDQAIGVKFETPAEAGLPPMLVNSYDATFSPRVGLAWQPFGKWGTVLRGAVGRYIYPVPVREEARLINRNNPFSVGYSESYTSSTYTPHTNYMMLSGPNYSPGFNYSTTTASSSFGPASSPTGAYTGGPGWPIAGFNSSSVINVVSTPTLNAITPGLSIVSINPDNPPSYVDEANFTVEQPMKWGSVLRVSYLYTHGTNLNNSFYYNDHPSTYSWEIQQGAPVPANPGTLESQYNGSTGQGPYDNTTYGSGNYQIQKSGWSNYNALQAVYQKLYHSGSGWQVMYVWEKNLRTGGDYGGESGDAVNPYISYVNSYLGTYGLAGANTVTVAPVDSVSSPPPTALRVPPPPPTGTPVWGYYKALNRWENYMVDTNTPPQHLQFNGLLDFPFGRGKRWLSGVNKPMNELVGGWQIAGAGGVEVTDFPILTTNWGPTNPLKVYKKSAPITDCRSGVCVKAYEWFNGYIAPTALSGNACSAGLPNVVSNLPGNWASFQTPMDIGCSAPSGGKTVTDKYYGDNDVLMSGVTGFAYPGAKAQANGTEIGYGIVPSNNDNGASEGAIDVTNPYSHTILNGPLQWNADASLFKIFPITERVNVRFNADAFNVFNHYNLPNPGSTSDGEGDGATTGIICYTPGDVGCQASTFNVPRQIQLTLRINF